MTRKVCITAADGETGFLIAELLLTDDAFKKQIDSLVGLTLHPTSAKSKELGKLGATVVPHKPGREKEMVKVLQQTGCDTICLIPPAHKDKTDITLELINAAKKAKLQNVLFISAAGCDIAERNKQPRLREFIDLETLVMQTKSDPSTDLSESPCILRAGFYAENLLLYTPQLQKEGTLPLPIAENHRFPPVALGDVAQVAANVLVGKGKHGFDDRHRGQLMIVTGPKMISGTQLAETASKALGLDINFESISESEAKRVLKHQASNDDSEKEYILEYYSLVREGKTNYVSTTAFKLVTGNELTDPDEFFRLYAQDLKLETRTKRRRTENSSS